MSHPSSERVLVVPGAEIDRLGRFQGFHPDAARYLAALLAPGCVLAQEPTVVAIFRRIHRDEAAHVRTSRRLASALARRQAIGLVAESTRVGLVGVLAWRGTSFERLGIDPGRLFLRLGRVPDGLFP